MTQENRIVVLAEIFGGIIAPHSHEMYTAGKALAEELGVSLTLAMLGTDQDEALANIGELDDSIKVETFLVEEGEDFPYEAWADVASEVIRKLKPQIALFSGNSFGLDYTPRVAARRRG